MSHPRDKKRIGGRIWHKEDSGLTLVDAKALEKHLRHTEDKDAMREKTPEGYEVWWAARLGRR
jgi:hypothetical protein